MKRFGRIKSRLRIPNHPDFAPQVHSIPNLDLRRLGSVYGGWVYHHSNTLRNVEFISAGVGEDISWDIEFISTYGASGTLIDPTPRSKLHFEEVTNSFGRARSEGYRLTGTQSALSYDLRSLTSSNLRLLERALWSRPGEVDFFAPPDTNHVSYSISDWQNGYSKSGAKIKVPTITPSELANDQVRVLKLDIEGAELEVVVDLASKLGGLWQILVEFDELDNSSGKTSERYAGIIYELSQLGFLLGHRENRNFLFLHTEKLKAEGGL